MGRREEKKAEKRERIEKTALDLFLDQGFDRASIEQVISGADIARGTFYLYYPDKLSVFIALQKRWLNPIIEALQRVHNRLLSAVSPAECVSIYQEMGQQLAVLGLLHGQEILLAGQELRSNHDAGRWLRSQEGHIQDLTTQLTEVAQAQGLIDAPNPRLASLLITGAIERLHYEFLTGTDLGNPVTLAQEATTLLSRILGLGLK